MRIRSAKSIMYLFVACILLTDLIISHKTMASNRAIDMKIIEQDKWTRFVLLLEETPRYSLRPLNGNQVRLTFYDTSTAPLIEKRITENNAFIKIDEREQSPDLRFNISLTRPFREIGSSWLPKEKLLYLEIFSVDESSEKKEPAQRPSNLKNIRFGIKEITTRIVMSLDRQPLWEMSYRDPTVITMQLEAISKSLKKKKYGPLKRVKEVVLKQDDNRTDMGIQLESQLNHIRIFWLEVGNRLVMDLFDKPAKISDEALLLTTDDDIKKEDDILEVKETDNKIKDEEEQPEQPAIQLEMKEADNEIKEEEEQPEQPAVQEMGHFVRMKIPEREAGDSNEIKGDGLMPTIDHDSPLMVEPRLDNILPESSDEKEFTHNLSPKEAFLFGRIQEAKEIHDFERGAVLVDHFLLEFPDSPLSEKISFWRGDFQYHLWKRNKGKKDKENSHKVLKSYKEAIRRYGKSKKVPEAYIKMAQASSFLGNDLEAMGFLNLVINNRKGDYLPMAYLTRGKIYLRMNQADNAIENFKTLLNRYPHSNFAGEAQFWTANYLHSKGVYEEAEIKLNEIADSDPQIFLKYPEYLLLSAQNYLYLQKYDLARDYLFRALNLGHQPETSDLLLSRIGDTYHHQNKEEGAEKFYRMVIDYYPDSEGAAIAKLRLADYFSDKAALEDLSKENIEGPLVDLALLGKAYKSYEKEQFLEVMDTLEGLIIKTIPAQARKEAKHLFYRAAEREISHLYKSGQYKELIDLYRSKQGILTGNIAPEIMFLVAQSLYDLRLYRGAISTFLEIKSYDLSLTSRGRHVLSLAHSYMEEGMEETAEKLLEEKRKEELPAADQQRMSILLADIYRKKGALRDAYSLYQSLVSGKRELTDTEIARAYLFMGKISSSNKHHEKARETLNQCIALAEKDKDSKELLQSAFMELGNSYYSERKHQQAIKSYEKGLNLGYSPDKGGYWEMRFRLALSYLEVGEDLKAEPLLTEIAEEGDPILQQKVQVKLGMIGLEKQLKLLSIWTEKRE